MAKTRIFVLDCECARFAHRPMLTCAALKLGKKPWLDIEIRISEAEVLRDLPRDYDTYLLHLANTTEDAVLELREEQPWSRIDGIRGANRLAETPEPLKYAIDKVHYVLMGPDYEEIIKNPRRVTAL